MKPKFIPGLLTGISVCLCIGTAHAVDYHWTGATSTNFQTPDNWTENAWTEWGDYHFGGTPTNSTVDITGSFGTGSLHLDSGLTTDITINSSNGSPLIMSAPWGLGTPPGSINIASDSSNLTLNTSYLSPGVVTWNIGAGRTFTFNGSLQDWNGTAGVNKTGAGTALLTGANTYGGGTVISGGMLQLSGAGTLGATSGALTINNATLDLGSTTQTVASVTSGDTASNNTGSIIGAGTLNVSGNFAYQGNGGNGADYGSNPTFTINSNVVVNGSTSVGRANLEITGGSLTTNSITTNAASADWARVVISGGTVTATNGIDLSLNSSVTGQLDLNGGTLYTPSLKVADRQDGGIARLTFNGTSVKATADTGTFITTYGGGNNAYISNGGAIIDTNGNAITIGVNLKDTTGQNGSLTKQGSGTLTLSGANSYTGVTSINAGTLVAASNTALGIGGWSGATLTDISSGATLALQGGITIADEHMRLSGAGVDGLGAIRSLSGNNVLAQTYAGGGSGPGFSLLGDATIGVDADTLSVTGFYHDSGSYGITKVGAGTLKFTEDYRYTGATTVSQGTLEIGGNSGYNPSNPGGQVTVASGATIKINSSANNALAFQGATPAWQVSGTINIASNTANTIPEAGVVLNNGTLTGLGTEASYGSLTAVNGSSSTITANGASNTISTTNFGIGDGVTVNLNTPQASDALAVSASFFGANSGTTGGLSKSGDGTVTLSGNSTYTGATLVSAGTLLVNGALGNTAVTVESSGTIGGSGSIAGSLSFGDGAKLTVNLADPLSITGLVSFANFGFDDLVGFDVQSVAEGTYTLLAGNNFNFTNVANYGLGNALVREDGKLAYFQSGSLQVVVIPEPRAALLGGLGMLMLLRRRR